MNKLKIFGVSNDSVARKNIDIENGSLFDILKKTEKSGMKKTKEEKNEKHLLLNEGRQALDLSHEDPLLDFKWLDVFLLHFGLSLLSRFCLGGLSDRILLVLDRTQVGLLIDVLVQRFLAQPRQRMRQRNRTYWNSVASLSAG